MLHLRHLARSVVLSVATTWILVADVGRAAPISTHYLDPWTMRRESMRASRLNRESGRLVAAAAELAARSNDGVWPARWLDVYAFLPAGGPLINVSTGARTEPAPAAARGAIVHEPLYLDGTPVGCIVDAYGLSGTEQTSRIVIVETDPSGPSVGRESELAGER